MFALKNFKTILKKFKYFILEIFLKPNLCLFIIINITFLKKIETPKLKFLVLE
jgi:hypothetical protein